MQKLKQKLKSQTGASITFALLLFLVCAVVGSAVLVAGTAAAGRMSKIAEMDQRYYAVNSAARFLIDTIEEETVTAIEEKTTTVTEGLSSTQSKYYLKTDSQAMDGTTTTDNVEVTSSASLSETFPQDAAYRLGYLSNSPEVGTQPYDYQLTIDADGAADNGNVKIAETLKTDGSMIFDIYKGEPPYTLRLTFALDKQETSSLDVLGRTETITRKLHWRLSDIETVTNQAQAPSSSPTVSGG